jgi:Zn-dependent protease with chaperone function
VRVLYPLLALLAYVHFVLALLVGFVLVATVPVLAIGFAALLLVGRQFVLLYRLLGSLLRLTFGSVGAAAGLLRELFLAIFERDEGPVRIPFAYGREALPELFRLVDEVAAEVKTAGIDRVLLTPDPECAVFDTAAPGALSVFKRRRRHLVLGLPYVYALSLDELRSVLAHELGHFTLGHLTLSRVTWHFIGRIDGRLERWREAEFHALNPLFWSTAASAALLAAIYHPWWRLHELDADRVAARTMGANHRIASLRKLGDLLAVAEATRLVALVARKDGVAPLHLGEAAARLSWRMDPVVKRRLAVQAEGDPHDLEGRTHPPTALRIAALRGVPEKPARHGELAARYLPDVRKLEEHITRVVLRIEATEPAKAHIERVVAHLAATPAA